MARLLLPARISQYRSSLLGALRACLSARGDTRPDSDLAGLSGLAFRLQADARVSPASVSAFPWSVELPGALSRLGYSSACIFADPMVDPRFAQLAAAAVVQITEALQREQPTILWGVHLPEFGFAHGVDSARRELIVAGVLSGRGASDSSLPDALHGLYGRFVDLPKHFLKLN